MFNASASDTIFAPATPPGRSALAVVRICGPLAVPALSGFVSRLPEERKAGLRRLRDPVSKELLDEALVLWFAGPNTETGEDMAELHLHGGRSVRDAVLAALGRLPGLRPAEPGEFTFRALRNGRLDLVQAEALVDLVDSETAAQRRQALEQMGGALSGRAGGWRDTLVGILARLDAELDFADEGDVASFDARPIVDELSSLRADLNKALGDRSGEIVREGVRVVVLGPPNAGKSSLVNALAGRDVAIVTDVPGTTRDALEVVLDLQGIRVVLTDTAGLRDTADAVEQIGVQRARDRAADADLILWLSPADAPAEMDEDLPAGKVLRVRSKSDLAGDAIVEESSSAEIAVSTVDPDGTHQLVAELTSRVCSLAGTGSAIVTRERHRRALEGAEQALRSATRLLSAGGELELAAEEVRRAMRALDVLVDRVDVETVLGAIFSRFCIGK
jgi:tRNA modification GTPase